MSIPKTSMETKAIIHDVPPYLTVYSDGTVDRFLGNETSPPSLNHQSGVSSKDILINPKTGLSARLYLPTNLNHENKLPIVVYFHGGAFVISSASDPLYHNMLNLLVKEAGVVLVSVDYRLAPENPLPTAYDDSWESLEWVYEHMSGDGSESWLKEHGDFDRLFLAGDSAGANISHHMAIRLAEHRDQEQAKLKSMKISGILMVQPYFWGEEAIGAEAENPIFKSVVDQWWRFVSPSDRGCDDPWINPFAEGAKNIELLGCDKVLVCIAGNDVLRERGRLYYETLEKSKWEGKVELFVTEGEDHVFHILDPTSQNAINLIKHLAQFISRKLITH